MKTSFILAFLAVSAIAVAYGQVVCTTKIDLVFCVDESGSISNTAFNDERNFINAIINRFNIGPNDVKVGLISFDTAVVDRFTLGSFNTKPATIAAVNAYTRLGGGTDIAACINRARTFQFQGAQGDRPDAQNVLMVLTDGQSGDSSAAANAARAAGIRIIAVGAGTGVNQAQLNAIANDPDSENVFNVADFNQAQSIADRISTQVCQGCDYDFKEATNFNLFTVDGDLTAVGGSDVQGRVGVCGSATLQAFSVGDALSFPVPAGDSTATPPTPAGRSDLIVQHVLNFASGNMERGGNIVHGNAGSVVTQQVGFAANGCPTCHGSTFLNAAALDCSQSNKDKIAQVSSNINQKTVNGMSDVQWGTLTLTGTSATDNVFSLSAATLQSAHTIVIDVPAGSRAIINVGAGGPVFFENKGLFGAGYTSLTGAASRILWNFPNASSLKISGIEVIGSVLAPKADLDYPSGLVRGQVVVKSMHGNGQVNYNPFDHRCPPAP